jgi:hypothetical protein
MVWIFVAALACLVLVVGTREVTARAVVDQYAGRFLILKKKPPSYFGTQGKFAKFIRKYSTKTVYENTDRKWVFETMAFFKKPLGDYEVEVVFYDIAHGKSKDKRRFVASFIQYTQDRNTRILFGKTELVRPDFDADKHYLVVARSRDVELATGSFKTRGTTQAAIDEQKRLEHEQKEMEKSMKELEQKAKEQEKRKKEKGNTAADDLF